MKSAERKHITVKSLLCTISISLLPIFASCIFDSAPEPSGFPDSVEERFDFTETGLPEMSEFSVSGELAIVTAGTKAAVIDINKCEIAAVLDLSIDIVDIGDTDVGNSAFLLTESLLFSLDLNSYSLGDPITVGKNNRYLSVSSESNCAWIAGEETLYMVDLASYQVTEISDSLFKECQGMIEFGDILVVADGSRSSFVAFETETWTEVGNYQVPGDVLDIFFGYNGFISAIVENSNEIWYIDPAGCTLEEMITFPVNPTAAASMPNGEFAYGACSGMGLVVVCKSGEIEFTSSNFGVPDHIKVNRDGTRAIICSQENEAVYILK